VKFRFIKKARHYVGEISPEGESKYFAMKFDTCRFGLSRQ